ncbi:MAG: 5-formyltetrahydrofolate cyclo-ligase [Erysipelotrichaceae bacterium]|nr:5-formyltetrahydrofolate cyclo-ligase [Erysipelotrichaceae bacterium]
MLDDQRKEAIRIRDQIPDRNEKQKAAAKSLLPFLHPDKLTAVYLPIGSEMDLFGILKYEYGFENLLVPKMKPHRKMIFARAEHLRPNHLGILEPEEDEELIPDVIIAPLLKFTKRGGQYYRMGYGGGYYDRYLENFSGKVIAAAFDEQEQDFQVQPWDQPIDVIATPKRVLRSNPELQR